MSVGIEEVKAAAESLATRPTKSMEAMHVEDRANGIEQMLLDLRKLAEADGCIAAAWAYEFALEIAAELARSDSERR